MKQYDVVKNPYRRAMPNVPLLLILQHDRNADSPRVLVGPLSTLGKPTRRDVALTVLGQPYVLLPLDLSAVPRDALSPAPSPISRTKASASKPRSTLFLARRVEPSRYRHAIAVTVSESCIRQTGAYLIVPANSF